MSHVLSVVLFFEGGLSPADRPDREDIPAHPDYLYHATNTERLHDIIDAGKLDVHGPRYGTDQSEWPDGSRKKRAYWTHEPKIARNFYPEEGSPALIRAKHVDLGAKRESTGDHYTERPTPIHKLEYYGGEGKWKSLHYEEEPK